MISRYLSQQVKEFYLKGIEDEEFVMKATQETFGGTCFKSSKKEDIFAHIDFFWNTPKGKCIGIDVKGIKKNAQKDKKLDDSINWVEIMNVRGDLGWLYGKSEYIAFRTFTDILFVKLKKLQVYTEEKIKGKSLVFTNPKDFYVPYQRYGRKDMVIKVPTSDLREIADFSIDLTDYNKEKDLINEEQIIK